MDDHRSAATSADVEMFMARLLEKSPSPAFRGLQSRSTSNVAHGEYYSPPAKAIFSSPSRFSTVEDHMAVADLVIRVAALEKQNALYLSVIERLRSVAQSRVAQEAAAQERSPLPASAASQVPAEEFTVEMEKMARELAGCRAVMNRQAAELAELRGQHCVLPATSPPTVVEQRVDGMQNQIDELRTIVRELSVQASQSRGPSAARGRLSPLARCESVEVPSAQEEVATLRALVRRQQQTIAGLQRRHEQRDSTVIEDPADGAEDDNDDNTNTKAEMTWEDPDPTVDARDTGLHSPSRASDRVAYAESEKSPDPARHSSGGSGFGAEASRSGGGAEPEPQVPHVISRVSVEDKENVCPQQRQPRPLQTRVHHTRGVQFGERAVEEVAGRISFCQSHGSENVGSDVNTPPPRRTVLLRGAPSKALALNEEDGDGQRPSGATDSLGTSPVPKKKTRSPRCTSIDSTEFGRCDADEKFEAAATPVEPSLSSSASTPSSDSFVGRKPRGAISLSRPRASSDGRSSEPCARAGSW